MKILIYGAGVIGTLYAVLFSKAGFDTSLYARGKRLRALREKGVVYYNPKSSGEKTQRISNIQIRETLSHQDTFDFIFVCVRENQLHLALEELRWNHSGVIVTMVNSMEEDEAWKRRYPDLKIIRAFPGAGGSIKDDILYAQLTPYLIQPTTFSETTLGSIERKVPELRLLFKKAGIAFQVVEDMYTWQICHIAMVVPLADAYYLHSLKDGKDGSTINDAPMIEENCRTKDKIDKEVWKNRDLMRRTASRLKENFKILKSKGYKISPKKLNLFLYLPTGLLTRFLIFLYRSEFANTFMYQHSVNAREEMRELHRQLYGFLRENEV